MNQELNTEQSDISSHALTIGELPQGSGEPEQAISTPHFPTAWQAVLWRNWELVPVQRIATVLEASEAQVLQAASDLGLRVPPHVSEDWLVYGYVTLIRVNWHLLTYKQLLQLLDWTPQHLDSVLREEDFLWFKLGMNKPDVASVKWTELSSDQQQATAGIRAQIETHLPTLHAADKAQPFEFRTLLEHPAPILPRRSREQRTGEVQLGPTWSIQQGATPTLARFTERFVNELRARWGTAPRLESKHEKVSFRQYISWEIVSDPGKRRESHRIRVTPESIEIIAVDEVGVLRGLQWLQNSCESAGGPFVPIGDLTRDTRFESRIIHPYCGVYGDPLMDGEDHVITDGLFSRLSRLGVNGIWLQSVLWSLAPWEYAPELSAGWQTRLANLRHLCDRAAEWGIGIYLYLNEPRALPVRFFEQHPELQPWHGISVSMHDAANLCTSVPEVREWMQHGVAHLFREVPQLQGLINITMSEALTNCHSRPGDAPCPRCSSRPIAEVISEVNATLLSGARQSKPGAQFITWTWGYNNDDLGLPPEKPWSHEAIKLFPQGIDVMCTSEEWLPTNVAGVEANVIDYSISQVGPSPLSRSHWKTARENGLSAFAKVQFNTTWENSAVPYIPTPDLIAAHLENLIAEGVTGLTLSWTVGGFPSLNLELASRYYWSNEQGELTSNGDVPRVTDVRFTDVLSKFADDKFGIAGPAVRQAWQKWSGAFSEFPFHIGGLYQAPYSYGPMNLLHAASTGRDSTMMGYPFDALDTWRSIYPRNIYQEQFRKLRDGWYEGLEIIDEIPTHLLRSEEQLALTELKTIASVCWLHWRSIHAQIAWICLRDDLKSMSPEMRETSLDQMKAILQEEIDTAAGLHELVRSASVIGYEASNHYYYTQNDLREKVISCNYLLEQFSAA